MECPVEGCDCKKTWSLSPEVAAQIKAHALNNADSPTNASSESVATGRRKPAMLLALATAVLIVGALVILSSLG